MYRGYTFLEVIITMCLLLILTVMIMPLFQQSLAKARRFDAKISLLDYSQRLHQCLIRNRNKIFCQQSQLLPAYSLHGFYAIQAEIFSNTEFKLSAKLINQKYSDPACGDFILYSNKKRDITGNANLAECW